MMARGQARGGCAQAKLFESVADGLPDLGMARQPVVIAAREVNQFTPTPADVVQPGQLHWLQRAHDDNSREGRPGRTPKARPHPSREQKCSWGACLIAPPSRAD